MSKEMEAAKVNWEKELTKIKAKKEDLKRQLQDSQKSFQTLQNDYVSVNGKISALEAKVKAIEKWAFQEAFIREVAIHEAEERAMERFKRSKEYMTSQSDQYELLLLEASP